MRIVQVCRVVVVLGLVLAASSPFAGDGVIEINQARALAGGLSAGDAADFPVTIEQPGSYRLVGNLDLTDPSACQAQGNDCSNVDAVVITSDNVTLDLNGFSIRGATTCSGTPVSSCGPSGTGRGITVTGMVRGLRIRGGSIRGMPDSGIDIPTGNEYVHVEDVIAVENGQNGIECFGDGCSVRDCTSSRNGNHGIRGGPRSSLIGNVVHENGGDGITLSGLNTVRNNTANENGGAGIDVGPASMVTHNQAAFNTAEGIVISATSTGYAHNVVDSNTGGAIVGGTNLGSNLCDTSICP